MTPTAQEILESPAWRESLAAIDSDLWAEHGRLKFGDTEGLLRIQACRWALEHIRDELAMRMAAKTSINLHK